MQGYHESHHAMATTVAPNEDIKELYSNTETFYTQLEESYTICQKIHAYRTTQHQFSYIQIYTCPIFLSTLRIQRK
jgi:hypothetical protein